MRVGNRDKGMTRGRERYSGRATKGKRLESDIKHGSMRIIS